MVDTVIADTFARRGNDEPNGQHDARWLLASARSVLAARWGLRRADHVGPRVRAQGRLAVRNDGRMIIHERVQLVSTLVPIELVTTPGGTLEVGERTFVNYGTSIAATSRVTIGARCLLGTYNLLMDNDFHHPEPERRMARPDSAPIVLEDDVWLGARVIVLRGVTIGEGSAVAAGSIVTRDVPPRTLVAGAPAKVVRRL